MKKWRGIETLLNFLQILSTNMLDFIKEKSCFCRNWCYYWYTNRYHRFIDLHASIHTASYIFFFIEKLKLIFVFPFFWDIHLITFFSRFSHCVWCCVWELNSDTILVLLCQLATESQSFVRLDTQSWIC